MKVRKNEPVLLLLLLRCLLDKKFSRGSSDCETHHNPVEVNSKCVWMDSLWIMLLFCKTEARPDKPSEEEVEEEKEEKEEEGVSA